MDLDAYLKTAETKLYELKVGNPKQKEKKKREKGFRSCLYLNSTVAFHRKRSTPTTAASPATQYLKEPELLRINQTTFPPTI